MPLSFETLRAANIARLPQFKNALGEAADWNPGDWMTAVVGELGEAANLMKKLKRGDFGPSWHPDAVAARDKLAKEFADVVTYLDILAYQYRIPLGDATAQKFNEVSMRVNAEVFIIDNAVSTVPF